MVSERFYEGEQVMSERVYSQVEAFKMLLNGKRMRPVGESAISYLFLEGKRIVLKYVDGSVFSASSTLGCQEWHLVEESIVEAGELFKKGNSNYVAVATGAKVLRLVDLGSWKSDSSINVYGMIASDIEKRYGMTKV